MKNQYQYQYMLCSRIESYRNEVLPVMCISNMAHTTSQPHCKTAHWGSTIEGYMQLRNYTWNLRSANHNTLWATVWLPRSVRHPKHKYPYEPFSKPFKILLVRLSEIPTENFRDSHRAKSLMEHFRFSSRERICCQNKCMCMKCRQRALIDSTVGFKGEFAGWKWNGVSGRGLRCDYTGH